MPGGARRPRKDGFRWEPRSEPGGPTFSGEQGAQALDTVEVVFRTPLPRVLSEVSETPTCARQARQPIT